MKKCPNCDHELPDSANKCKYCDYKFDQDNNLVPEQQPEKILTRSRWGKPILFGISFFLVLLAIMYYWTFIREEPNRQERPTTPEYLELTGHVWSGVKVYMGESKMFKFTIVGASSNECSFGNGLLVEFPSGSTEWKSRSALILNDYLFVRSDDPALQAEKYDTFFCPE